MLKSGELRVLVNLYLLFVNFISLILSTVGSKSVILIEVEGKKKKSSKINIQHPYSQYLIADDRCCMHV